ncbi:bifunctional (p)ppGpp synthetase/guanosine-3',5'-bis(diphosphate) 3'-pyrophosphohydrolase [Thiomicrorhabdus sp. ZW0627]|uniref:RelA/SpoT family protein n=1 Tax=Thiomicrorhabdus sp. ZW0627 TaxID=3039774 RepID=UPI002436C518|nr:bifunctional (p)ppGpp synthetase/guanosine-3',5'-bis(diphosphate) 3'-pyrophosphohydrolase [Thiomicrorhabdus sp. ZW0627]MDG6772932.1 bifunctional (p)ppGpp synthetase/guanosine-3',5'-bis(diphosphate) 3'-pyrophosphohydrolase [Thiomicrorhabdus sp. ZW0627]
MTSKATELFKLLFKPSELTGGQLEKCQLACNIAVEAMGLPEKSIVRSVDVALILSELNMDADTLVATLLSDGNVAEFYDKEYIEKHFGDSTAELVEGIRYLNQFKELDSPNKSDIQYERLRQMLLAMTTDIRIMVVKLAYRVARLRQLKFEEPSVRQQIAEQTQLIFAPLANRLGIAQLKWELEDLSFRFLEPDQYREIAQQLDSNRLGREAYIDSVIEILKTLLESQNIEAKITGRPKHIYSIWKKMQRKKQPIDELFDLRAVRIYVDSVKQCYEVLGLIHSHWSYIKEEFDDYITSPKDNGYQSIHTVILGPEGKTVEIQIRTFDMHRHAEYGVAAHWRYKEGGKNIDKNLEKSIANVRQLLENADDPEVFKEISTELQSQHIYVLTPQNEIMTLRQGSTPLDFAYTIHTELGHGCRGAKINGRIQPLTTVLKTGDKVEVLSVKNGGPSRNWLNPNLGYLNSSSARTKVKGWFNKQNRAQNIQAGEGVFNREIRRLHATTVKAQVIARRFKYENEDDLYEAIGKGQLNERQLANAIQENLKPEQKSYRPKGLHKPENIPEDQQVYVVGATQLKTNLAPCCQPEKGDDIVGYVTRGRGVTVHRSDCPNILNLTHEELQRIIEVSWSYAEAEAECYTADLSITAFDRKGLLRDVMSVLTDLDINLITSETHTDSAERTVEMKLTLEVEPQIHLGELLDHIERIQNVESASISKI